MIGIAHMTIPSQVVRSRDEDERGDTLEHLIDGLGRSNNSDLGAVDVLLEAAEALVDGNPLPAKHTMRTRWQPRR